MVRTPHDKVRAVSWHTHLQTKGAKMRGYVYPGYVYFVETHTPENDYRSATVMDTENAFGQFVVSTYDVQLRMETTYFRTHASATHYAIEYVNGTRKR